jgi:hypothetical protein
LINIEFSDKTISRRDAENRRDYPTEELTDDTVHIKRRELLLVIAIASIISVGSFFYFYAQGMTNVYGDGIARLNIARKVVDHPDNSIWQHYIQTGSPWLPLQTFFMLPFVANDRMWRTGVAGSIISMLFYIIGAISLYLHAKILYKKEEGIYSSALPLMAAAVFVFNPSIIYMQATPMTELVFMGALAAAACTLQFWVVDQSLKRLILAAFVMTLTTLSRYEAWSVAVIAVCLVAILSRTNFAGRIRNTFIFGSIVSLGPIYWLWHNWAIYGNALEFLTGPYSARAIYLNNPAKLGWARIFVGNAPLDLLLMLFTVAVLAGPLFLLLAIIGQARLVLARRLAILDYAPAFLLSLPFCFHVFSVYRGEMQLFPLSAFGLLNVRYGLLHLMAVAIFAPAVVPLFNRFGKVRAVLIVSLIFAAQYGMLLSEGISQIAIYQEAFRNGVVARIVRDRAKVTAMLHENPPRSMILMHTGALGPVVSEGGLKFCDIIHEGSIGWHSVTDRIPDEVETVIMQEDDPLDQKFRDNASLSKQLADDFRLVFSVAKVKLYERIKASQ